MKGGSLVLRSTKLSFILVTLVCATIVIWGWDKAPFLVSLSQSLKLSPDIFIGSALTNTTLEPQRHEVDNLGTSARNETIVNPKEQDIDLEAQSDSAKKFKERSNKEDGNISEGKDGNAPVQLGPANTSFVAVKKEQGNFAYQQNEQRQFTIEQKKDLV